jgi:photosystem II stability/assembly factor-like uncharacterized protein
LQPDALFDERRAWRRIMTTVLLALRHALLVARDIDGAGRTEVQLEGRSPRCVAADPHQLQRAYCGTFNDGLWRSDDLGASWRPAGRGIAHPRVTAVSVSPNELVGGYGTVYAGTEPSALFRSDDGGDTWRELAGLASLPSASTWSFPPRPKTHHVRWVAPDPVVAGRLFVCVENGALVRSRDSGATWQDRTPESPRDTHTLCTHPLVNGGLYAAAGDGFMNAGNGFARSHDAGDSWQRPDEGLAHHYLWGAAVDPGDPETIVVSAAESPVKAHDLRVAESFIYRRTPGEMWRPITDGLPDAKGTMVSILATLASQPGVFYAANNRGLYRSADAGLTWERLDIPWPRALDGQPVHGMAVVP